MTFEEKVERLNEVCDSLHDRESMKEMAIAFISNDDEYLAIHILEALRESNAEWFDWDATMGVLDSVTPVETNDDLDGLYF